MISDNAQKKTLLTQQHWFHRHWPAFAQMIRVMSACAFAYIIVRAFGLTQGFWAILTVLIVMQGSVGATLDAATNRMIATIAGAVVGGIAIFLTPHEPLAIGVALVCVVGPLSFAAAINPRLRNTSVTAAIVILTRAPEMPVGTFVIDRILEIALGGMVGVIASRFILPAHSATALIDRLTSVLDAVADLLRHQADALEHGEAFQAGDAAVALRATLTTVEALLADADRERTAMLGKHGVSGAIPRTLWRIRNDITHVSRLIETPLAPAMLSAVGPQAAALLREEAAFAEQCGEALKKGDLVRRGGDQAVVVAFEHAFSDLRQARITQDMKFDEVGRLFGLAFALPRMRQDFLDLADRIDETAKPDPLA
jgi:uncharacterized membrane protein YccC